VLDAAFATVLILAVFALGTAGIYALSRLLRRDGTDDGAEPIET
jgi:amino acid permease